MQMTSWCIMITCDIILNKQINEHYWKLYYFIKYAGRRWPVYIKLHIIFSCGYWVALLLITNMRLLLPLLQSFLLLLPKRYQYSCNYVPNEIV